MSSSAVYKMREHDFIDQRCHNCHHTGFVLTFGRMVASLSPVSKYLKTVVTFSISDAVNWSSAMLLLLTMGMVTLGVGFPLESSELWGVRGGLALLSFFMETLDIGKLTKDPSIIKKIDTYIW